MLPYWFANPITAATHVGNLPVFESLNELQQRIIDLPRISSIQEMPTTLYNLKSRFPRVRKELDLLLRKLRPVHQIIRPLQIPNQHRFPQSIITLFPLHSKPGSRECRKHTCIHQTGALTSPNLNNNPSLSIRFLTAMMTFLLPSSSLYTPFIVSVQNASVSSLTLTPKPRVHTLSHQRSSMTKSGVGTEDIQESRKG